MKVNRLFFTATLVALVGLNLMLTSCVQPKQTEIAPVVKTPPVVVAPKTIPFEVKVIVRKPRPPAPKTYILVFAKTELAVTDVRHESNGAICFRSLVSKQSACIKTAEFVLLGD